MSKRRDIISTVALALFSLCVVMSPLLPMSLLVILFFSFSLFFVKKPAFLLAPLFVSSLNNTFFAVAKNISDYKVIAILMIIYSIINLKNFKIRSIVSIAFILMLIFFNFISCLNSITGRFGDFETLSLSLVLIFFAATYKVDNLNMFIKGFSISCVVSLLFLMLYSLKEGMGFMITDRFSFKDVNENDFAMMFTQIGIVLISCAMFLKMHSYWRIVYILAYFISLVIILLAGSRSAFLGSAITTIFYFLFVYNSFAKNKGKLFFALLLLLMAYFSWDFISTLNLPFISRFTVADVMDTRGGTRFDLIDFAIHYTIPQHFWMGCGLGGINVYAYANSCGVAHSAHNIIIDTFSQIGFIGFLLYSLFIYKFLKVAIGKCRSCVFYMLPLMMLTASFVNGMGETIFNLFYFWIPFALINLINNNYGEYPSVYTRPLY